MQAVHDVAGARGFGPVVGPGYDKVFHERWEARAFAIQMLVNLEGLGAGPGGRATRETMPPGDYLQASYYERWLWSAERRLERKGHLAPGEVEAMMERLRGGRPAPDPSRIAPDDRESEAARIVAELKKGLGRLAEPATTRFAPGDRVRARRMRPAGHTRCPSYVRGAIGVVERIQGEDELPDVATYRADAPIEPVYSVAFRSEDLWGPDGEPPSTVLVDLWESYLEPDDG